MPPPRADCGISGVFRDELSFAASAPQGRVPGAHFPCSRPASKPCVKSARARSPPAPACKIQIRPSGADESLPGRESTGPGALRLTVSPPPHRRGRSAQIYRAALQWALLLSCLASVYFLFNALLVLRVYRPALTKTQRFFMVAPLSVMTGEPSPVYPRCSPRLAWPYALLRLRRPGGCATDAVRRVCVSSAFACRLDCCARAVERRRRVLLHACGDARQPRKLRGARRSLVRVPVWGRYDRRAGAAQAPFTQLDGARLILSQFAFAPASRRLSALPATVEASVKSMPLPELSAAYFSALSPLPQCSDGVCSGGQPVVHLCNVLGPPGHHPAERVERARRLRSRRA